MGAFRRATGPRKRSGQTPSGPGGRASSSEWNGPSGAKWTNSVGPSDASLRGAYTRGRDCAQLCEPDGISCGRAHDRRPRAGHAGSVPRGLDRVGCGSVD
ncbi:hypothetical protein BC828DRAFT_389264 [Blastocladiella britannica]|nr:hypothetical protein BC828DRAFT_389264 [Blastocladiella britannica]